MTMTLFTGPGQALAKVALELLQTFGRGPARGIVTRRSVAAAAIMQVGYHAECGQVHPQVCSAAPVFAVQVRLGEEYGWVLVSEQQFHRYRRGDHYPRHDLSKID